MSHRKLTLIQIIDKTINQLPNRFCTLHETLNYHKSKSVRPTSWLMSQWARVDSYHIIGSNTVSWRSNTKIQSHGKCCARKSTSYPLVCLQKEGWWRFQSRWARARGCCILLGLLHGYEYDMSCIHVLLHLFYGEISTQAFPYRFKGESIHRTFSWNILWKFSVRRVLSTNSQGNF